MLRQCNKSKSDILQLKALWTEAFGEETEYMEEFFDRVFSPEHTLCCCRGETVAAMLYWLPCTITRQGETYKAAYFYALATKKEFRNQGIMGSLIEEGKHQAALAGCRVIFLIPAQEGLFDYYHRFGFEPMEQKKLYELQQPSGAVPCINEKKNCTNVNLHFLPGTEGFCREWALKEDGARLFELAVGPLGQASLLGREQDGVFTVFQYSLTGCSFLEVGELLALKGIHSVRVTACENPQPSCFSEAGLWKEHRISVCSDIKLKELNGFIPV